MPGGGGRGCIKTELLFCSNRQMLRLLYHSLESQATVTERQHRNGRKVGGGGGGGGGVLSSEKTQKRLEEEEGGRWLFWGRGGDAKVGR